jgi:hypothetical protein
VGPEPEDAGEDVVPDAGVASDPAPDPAPDPEPAHRLVHFQVNIEWTVEDMGEAELHHRLLEKRHLPDVLALQELWPRPLCGHDNVRGDAARVEQQACIDEDYGGRSFMGLLRRHTGRDYEVRYVADHANVVVWDADRLEYQGGTQWRFGQTQALRDACCGGAATARGCAIDDMIGIAVRLRDGRLTPTADDDVLVAVASVHTGGFGGSCIRAQLEHAETVFDRWAERAELPLARRFVSGDLNTRPDTRSATAAARRREERPDCWWRSFVRGRRCASDAGNYFDAVWQSKWDGSTRNDAAICAQWTWPMNTGNLRRCDRVADGAGQVYGRIDYTFVKGVGLTADMIRSHTDAGYYDADGDGRYDAGEAYSDSHRGIYTVVDYGS